MLIVDDHDDERAIQAAILTHLGYTVLQARDGEEALALARRQRPQAVLLDVAMPRMDGFAVARALRAGEETRSVAIILLTASALVDLEERAAQAGADALIRKPVPPSEVAGTVRRLIGEA